MKHNKLGCSADDFVVVCEDCLLERWMCLMPDPDSISGVAEQGVGEKQEVRAECCVPSLSWKLILKQVYVFWDVLRGHWRFSCETVAYLSIVAEHFGRSQFPLQKASKTVGNWRCKRGTIFLQHTQNGMSFFSCWFREDGLAIAFGWWKWPIIPILTQKKFNHLVWLQIKNATICTHVLLLRAKSDQP